MNKDFIVAICFECISQIKILKFASKTDKDLHRYVISSNHLA